MLHMSFYKISPQTCALILELICVFNVTKIEKEKCKRSEKIKEIKEKLFGELK